MNPVCFVVMPFGGLFDDIYREIYAPAIREAGLEPLRADDIYDNQPIIQDIKQAIRDAALVLAEVSDRNPNVNYELGMAHALEKEVVIVTARSEDVPSDYRHMRYIRYHSGGIGWDRKLTDELTATLRTVLKRLNIPAAPGPVLQRGEDGFYQARIVNIYHHTVKKHCFYRLHGLLPLSQLNGAEDYLPDESHWLADWGQEAVRFQEGDAVRFKVTSVSGVGNWRHVQHARTVNFIL